MLPTRILAASLPPSASVTTMASIFVHGGVSGLAREAPDISYAVVVAGSSALDLVEAAVRALEDDPALNAGRGAVLNRDGELELDAGIADGATGRAAGIANVPVAHPITLARKVLEETPHVLLTGAGARAFGAGMEQLTATPEQQARWESERGKGGLDLVDFGAPGYVDTVGAVALDDDGNLAAASSTGGVFGKMRGRVGDAPVFGAGFYASRRAAVVGTGVGELFLETLAAGETGRLIEDGAEAQDACDEVIVRLGERDPSLPAGLLALDAGGRAGAAFRGGSWAVAGPSGPVPAAEHPLTPAAGRR